MRIALCLSGLPKFLDRGHEYLNHHILSKYDVDVFAHTWWDYNMVDIIQSRNYTYTDDVISKIVNLYKPKTFCNQPQKQFDIKTDVDYETMNPISPYSMYYSIKMSNMFKCIYETENNFKYDVVIRSRFDIKLDHFSIDMRNIGYGGIYVDSVGEKNDYPNDQFALGKSLIMDYYSSLYDFIPQYYNDGFKRFVGERLLNHHMENSLFNIYMRSGIKNDIIKI